MRRFQPAGHHRQTIVRFVSTYVNPIDLTVVGEVSGGCICPYAQNMDGGGDIQLMFTTAAPGASADLSPRIFEVIFFRIHMRKSTFWKTDGKVT